jgi:hypothetical protein
LPTDKDWNHLAEETWNIMQQNILSNFIAIPGKFSKHCFA